MKHSRGSSCFGWMVKSPKAGFTIVELMLATAIFSIVLLGALAGFIQVSRLFYKGVSITNTQNVATQILNDITNSMQESNAKPSTQSQNGYNYICIGSTRYTYITESVGGQLVGVPAQDGVGSTPNYNNSASGGNFGLLKDNLVGSSACSTPCASGCGLSGFDKSNPAEMLDDQMRIANLTITQVAGANNLYNINIVVAFGDNSVLNFSNPTQPTCVGGPVNQAFCSVANISTTVFAGVRS